MNFVKKWKNKFMWIVAKYKSKNFNILKDSFKKVLDENPFFFRPKFKYQKVINKKFKTLEKFVLENYLICYHKKFEDTRILERLKFAKGLSYFLLGYKNNQNEIISFVKHCKKFEDENGYLKQDFFTEILGQKNKFISGPLTNTIFEIITNHKNNIKVMIGNITAIIDKDKNYLYRSVN